MPFARAEAPVQLRVLLPLCLQPRSRFRVLLPLGLKPRSRLLVNPGGSRHLVPFRKECLDDVYQSIRKIEHPSSASRHLRAGRAVGSVALPGNGFGLLACGRLDLSARGGTIYFFRFVAERGLRRRHPKNRRSHVCCRRSRVLCMRRDGHDGNTKCQCCAQAKRQYEEVLREMEARFVRSTKIIEEMGAAKTTKEKLLSTGLVIDAEKERYRLLTGRSIWKTVSEPESLQKAKQLPFFVKMSGLFWPVLRIISNVQNRRKETSVVHPLKPSHTSKK